MAQYNLVGYNSAPRNIEYEQIQAGLDKTPRTNWAEYALKEKQLKEQKKQNRFQNALNIVNTIATGVNTYENVLNSELNRKTRELQNQELSLDIQSKTIDVNKKSEEAKKDLEFATKIREIQESKDWNRASELLADPETAIRNKNLTKTLIEQLRFNGFKDGADNLYTSLFPDEKYERDQNELKRQDQFRLEAMRQAGANQRTRMQIEAQQPLRDAQVSHYIASTNKINAEYEAISNNGRTIAEQRRLMTEWKKSFDDLQTEISIDPTLGELNNGNVEQTANDLISGNTQIVDLNNIQAQATVLSDLKQRLEGGVNNNDALSRIMDDLGGTPKGEELAGWAADNAKLRLVVTESDDGTRSYNIVSDKVVRAANNAMNKGTALYSQNALENIHAQDGNLSKLSPIQLNALASKSTQELNTLNTAYGGNLLSTATPKQQRTRAFRTLANKLEQPLQQSAQQAVSEQPTRRSLDDLIGEGARGEEGTITSRANTVIQGFVNEGNKQELAYLANIGLRKANRKVDVNSLSPQQLVMYAKQGYETVEKEKRTRIANEDLQNLGNADSTSDIQSILDYQLNTRSPEQNFEDTIEKYNKTALVNVRKTSNNNKEALQSAENNFYDKEITALAKELGTLLDTHPEIGTVRIGHSIGGVDNSTSVNNWIQHAYKMIFKEDEAAPKRRGVAALGGGEHTRERLIEELSETIDNAIKEIKREK